MDPSANRAAGSPRPGTPGRESPAEGLEYYNDHKDEVEADFAEDERLAAEGIAREAEIRRLRPKP
jgi:hypothetical protein